MRSPQELARIVDKAVAEVGRTLGPAEDPLRRRREVSEAVLSWLRVLEPLLGRRAGL